LTLNKLAEFLDRLVGYELRRSCGKKVARGLSPAACNGAMRLIVKRTGNISLLNRKNIGIVLGKSVLSLKTNLFESDPKTKIDGKTVEKLRLRTKKS